MDQDGDWDSNDDDDDDDNDDDDDDGRRDSTQRDINDNNSSNEHNNLTSPTSSYSLSSLQNWLYTQRSYYQKYLAGEPTPLTETRLKKLRSLGVLTIIDRDEQDDITIADHKWMDAYEQLRELHYQQQDKDNKKKSKNSTNIFYGRDSIVEGHSFLYYWILRQRRLHRLGLLSPDRIARLDELGFFAWSAHDDTWFRFYQSLQVYHSNHGNCLVPREYPPNPHLAKWVNTQRYRYQRQQLAEERIALLEGIGFAWNAHDAKWDAAYQELQEYVQRSGRPGRVPVEQGSLRNWIRYQIRKFGKVKELDEKMKGKLEKLQLLGYCLWIKKEKRE